MRFGVDENVGEGEGRETEENHSGKTETIRIL